LTHLYDFLDKISPIVDNTIPNNTAWGCVNRNKKTAKGTPKNTKI
jgi:hypothetical protein